VDGTLSGIRIVIAEDHDDTRDILERVLGYLGATVTAVATAREALALVSSADMILTDFSLPEEDGVWLLEQVNQQPHPVPVVSVSGYAASQVPRLAQAPFARKLLKPIDPWVLGGIIHDVLRGRDGDSPAPGLP
jgi:CheY-like chemotaxis protein